MYYIKVTSNTKSGYWDDDASLIVDTIEQATKYDNYRRADFLCGSLPYFYPDCFFQRKKII